METKIEMETDVKTFKLREIDTDSTFCFAIP